jgi:hypothetical protein
LLKFRYNESGALTAGLHVGLSPEGLVAINLIVRGATRKVKFPLSALLHLEDRESGSDESMVELIFDPPAINFPPNKFVTDWQPITTKFKVCNAIMHNEPNSNLLFIQDLYVASGAIVRWTEHKVLCRYRL